MSETLCFEDHGPYPIKITTDRSGIEIGGIVSVEISAGVDASCIATIKCLVSARVDSDAQKAQRH